MDSLTCDDWRMRVFYDCEFIENGSTIDLISIGMVRDDGQELYAIAEEIQTDSGLHARIAGHPWLMEHVVPHLPLGKPTPETVVTREIVKTFHPGIDIERHTFALDLDHPAVLPRRVIAKLVRTFLGDDPELWAYYAAYDHVCLAQLWGPMANLPPGIPMWTNDLRQTARQLGDPQMPPKLDAEHNALADARWNRDAYRALSDLAGGQL